MNLRDTREEKRKRKRLANNWRRETNESQMRRIEAHIFFEDYGTMTHLVFFFRGQRFFQRKSEEEEESEEDCPQFVE